MRLHYETRMVIILSVLLTGGFFAAAYWWELQNSSTDTTAVPELSIDQATKSTSTIDPKSNFNESAQQRLEALYREQRAQRRPSQFKSKQPTGIYKYVDSEGVTHYGDQIDTVGQADNRISVIPTESLRENARRTELQRNAKKRSIKRSQRKPNLQWPKKDVPYNTKPECRFALGRASEDERMLRTSGNPHESMWRKGYCRWRKELRKNRCEVPRGYFYYNNLC